MTINVVAKLTVAPGKGPALEAAVAAGRAAVLANPDCFRYDLQRQYKSETDYIMLESWASTAALKAHGASENFKEFSRAAADILVAAPEVSVYEPVGDQVM